MDLANRCVLGQQQAVSLAQFGDIAHEQHTTGDFAVVDDGDAARQQRHVGVLVELLDHGFDPFVGLAYRTVVEAELRQTHSDCVGADADPVQC